MPSHHELVIAATAGVLSIFALIMVQNFRSSTRRRSKGLPFPPGPRPLPIIGNLLDVPKAQDRPWLVYDQMAKQYGDIFHMNVLGQHMIFLGSTRRTSDLLEKRSLVYSDRMHSIMLSDLIGWDFSFTFQHYGDQWRTHRRLFHKYFSTAAVDSYRPVEVREARAFLRRLLDTPEDFLDHIRHTFFAVIMSVAYGIQIEGIEDAYLKTGGEAMYSAARAGVAGSFLVDIMPFLQYVPAWAGATFKKQAAEWRKVLDTMINRPFNAVEAAMKEGVALPSVARTIIENLGEEEDESTRAEMDIVARKCLATMFAGGAETSISTMQSFFLAMTMFPEVQKKAQEELDRVIGPGRLPDYGDINSLPYIRAMVRETTRWQLVLPLSIPHATIEDDVYEGYFIPKGSVVVGLAWTILHDPELYPEPNEYRPERFLGDSELNSESTVTGFGFGRRVCPGKYMSEKASFINIASLLSVYDITPPLDEAGKPVALSMDMTSGLLSFPQPFKCIITPRSESAVRLIMDSEATD